ncbi:8901_t:CDS:2 [Funneliformis geosporum]|nr:8901_t:CDS:2 [Funneliformis geosporum]
MAGNVFVKNDAYDKRALIHYNEDKGEYKNINLILPFEFRKLNIPSSVPMVAASIAAAQSQMESNTSPLQLISILLTSIVQKLEISQLIYVLYEVLRLYQIPAIEMINRIISSNSRRVLDAIKQNQLILKL